MLLEYSNQPQKVFLSFEMSFLFKYFNTFDNKLSIFVKK
jgi:hypothetical protein